MKIGICTLHFANNFGAILQTFALQETLKNMGHEVEILRVKNHRKPISKCNSEGFENSQKYLNISDEIYNNEKHEFDAIIVGSDELWNLNNPSFEHLDEYFGENFSCEKIIAYAPSSNGTNAETVKKAYGIRADFSKFTALSARDAETQKLIKELSGIDATQVLDPTLLLESYDKYIKYKEPDKKDYILLYGYKFNDEERKQIQEFAKQNNKTVYSVGLHSDWCETLEADIFEFLGYIKNADYVISNSFHGLLFSIILEKNFGTFAISTKIRDVLEKFELEDRNLCEDTIQNVFEKPIDYEKINKIKLEKRAESLEYLKNALN